MKRSPREGEPGALHRGDHALVTPRTSGLAAAGRCIIVGHRVVTRQLERDHDLALPDFLRLVDLLLASGCTFDGDLAGEPRDGAVVLTFDDATDDHRLLAHALADRGVPAVFFIPPGLLGTPGHLNASDVRELVDGGHVIGSHGWSHRRLDLLPVTNLAQEVESSRAALEDLAGVPVTVFAPAGGIGVASLPSRLRAAGYVASRSTRWGIYRRPADRWRIPAIPVTPVTIDRGWVARSATSRRLPLAMIALGALRDVLSPDTRTKLRGRLHQRHGRAAAARAAAARAAADGSTSTVLDGNSPI